MQTQLNAPKERILFLSLLPSNINNENFENVYASLEKMDEDFYSKIPDFNTLLRLYFDESDDTLYSQKDLYTILRRRFIIESKIDINDIDECYSYSLRIA